MLDTDINDVPFHDDGSNPARVQTNRADGAGQHADA